MKRFVIILLVGISLSLLSCRSTKVFYTKTFNPKDKVHREYARRARTNKRIQLYYQYEHSGKAKISRNENQSRKPVNHYHY